MMINSKECTEIYEFLGYMNKTDVMKIPEEILLYIKNNRDKEYKTKITKDELFDFNNLSENSLNFLMYLDQTFIMSNNKKQMESKNENPIFIDKKLEKENTGALIELKKSNKIFELIKKFLKLK